MSSLSGKKLREIRTARGLSQKQFAQLLGVSRSHLTHLELGRYRVCGELAEKVSNIVADSAPPKGRPVLARVLNVYGITPVMVAKEIGVSVGAVTDILAGEPNRLGVKKQIQKWAAARGLPSENLFNEQEEPPMEAVYLTEAAKARFRIFADPFDPDLDPETFFGAKKNQWPEIAAVEQQLRNAYLNQKNIAIRGQVGSGKSTLNRRVLGNFEKSGESVFVIEPEIVDKALLRPSLILESIIRAANVGTSKRSLGNSLEERSGLAKLALTTVADRGLKASLLIEEAHLLPDDTIKHFKSMSEWYRGVDKLLSIVMIGQPELDIKIKRWANRQWFSRCVTIHMPGLGKKIPNYLHFRCEAKGVDSGKVFTEAGVAAIADRMKTQTYDTPLLVGNFTKHCINKAAALGTRVDERVVMEARPVLRPEKAQVRQIKKRKAKG